MLASIDADSIFSNSLAASGRTRVSTSLVARRRFLDVSSGQKRREQQQQLNQNQYNLHVPSSIRCPIELSPIDSALGDFVPFADALRSVRSRCLPNGMVFNTDEFEWLESDQVNNSSGESSSRKVAAKESAKRDIDNYFFMYFRVRMENYVALVIALKQSSREGNIFMEENLDRWTYKFKFRIRRATPLKYALLAFSSRMGLNGDPNVMYCLDGFYGDGFTGRSFNTNEVPNNRVLPANNSLASHLRNGSNIFVSRITDNEKNNAFAQFQLDMLKGNDPTDEESQPEPEPETKPQPQSPEEAISETIKELNSEEADKELTPEEGP